MLTIILPILSLSLIFTYSKLYWWVSASSTIFICLLSIISISSSSYLTATSSFSMMDTMSGALIILSILIAALMMSASTKIYLSDTSPFMFTFMNFILLFILICSFSASSIISFYVWFEASLIPTMIIIMTWGYQPERMQASMYLMLYTVTASLPMLVMFTSMYLSSSTSMMFMSSDLEFPMKFSSSSIFWLVAIVGFLVKLPMFSVHLWLPKAHVEAPIAGSMVLAAILLKLGGYGLVRMLSLFSKFNNFSISSMLMSVALWGASLTSMICMRQPDLKSLIAYSSVGHMGLMLAGALTNTCWGMSGTLMIMIAHGLCSSALFIMANMSYEITSTRSMFLTKGLMSVTPIMAMWWFLFSACNMAAPPSINLLSEIMLITSIMSNTTMSLISISLISFLTAAYSLHMYSTVQHGHLSSFANPLQVMKSKDMALLLTHLFPIIAMIIKPEIISNWLW